MINMITAFVIGLTLGGAAVFILIKLNIIKS